jgi:2-methylcitrate dehydratase PrpD
VTQLGAQNDRHAALPGSGDITHQLAALAVGTTIEDLSDEVIGATERVVLDTIGCAAGGLTTTAGGILADLKRRAGGTEEATLIGQGVRVPATSAAYVHAHAANLLDADETLHNRTHLSACVVMPALALAESVGVRGDALLAAVAVGYDVAARIRVSNPFYDTSVPGDVRLLRAVGNSAAAIGTAAAAASLLGLSQEQTEHALGIAYVSAPVRRVQYRSGERMNDDLGMTKATFFSPVGEAGVNAALLAQAGFLTNPGSLDARCEFWQAFGAESCDFDVMLGDIGRRWYIAESAIKPYPNCRQGHVAIRLFEDLVEREGWQADDIEDVLVRIPASELIRELAETTDPGSTLESQYSLPYAFAMIVDRVPAGPAWHADDRFRAGRWKRFAAKVRSEVDPEWSKAMMDEVIATSAYQRMPAEVQVTAHGRMVSAFADRPPGDPWNDELAYDRDDIADKFRTFACHLIAADKLEEAIEHAWSLRDGGDVRSLMRAVG